MPLPRVAVVCASFHRPLRPLIYAAFVFFLAANGAVLVESAWPLLVGLVFAALLVVVYFLTKSLNIEVHPFGGPPIVVSFRPNVIEGIPVDLAKAKDAINVIADLLQATRQHDEQMPHPVQQFSAPVPQPLEHGPQADKPPSLSDSDEARAKARFDRARQLVAAGDRDGAIHVLESIARDFPGTRAAENAKRNLEKTQRPASPT